MNNNCCKRGYTSVKTAVFGLVTALIFVLIVSSPCAFTFISYADGENGETTAFDDETLETKREPISSYDETEEKILGYVTLSDNAESLETAAYVTLLPETTTAETTAPVTEATESESDTEETTEEAQTTKSEEEERNERLSDNNIGVGKYVLIAIGACMVVVTVMVFVLRSVG